MAALRRFFANLSRVSISWRRFGLRTTSRNTRTKPIVANDKVTEIAKERAFAGRLADRYNHNYHRIAHLRETLAQPASTNDIGSRLRLISPKEDLKISALSVPRTAGDSKKSGSWIWSVFDNPQTSAKRNLRKRKREEPEDKSATGPEPNAPTDWKVDGTWGTLHCDNNPDICSLVVECKQWQRARAEKSRYDEAVSGTCADFRHTVSGFATFHQSWTVAAEASQDGKRAYAYRQAAMYERMHDECQKAYDSARRPGIDGDQLDHSMVRDYRPCSRSRSPADVGLAVDSGSEGTCEGCCCLHTDIEGAADGVAVIILGMEVEAHFSNHHDYHVTCVAVANQWCCSRAQ